MEKEILQNSIFIKTIVTNAVKKISQFKFNSEIDNIKNMIRLVSNIVYSSVQDGKDFNSSQYTICCVTSFLLYQILNLPTNSETDIIFNVEIYYSEIINNAIKKRDEIIQTVTLIYNNSLVTSNLIPNTTLSEIIKIAEHYSNSHNSIYIIASNIVLDLVKNNPTIDSDILIGQCVNKLLSIGCDVYVTSAIVGSTISLIRNNIGSKLSIKEKEYLGLISGCAANIKEVKHDETRNYIVKKIHKKIEKNGKEIGAVFIVLTIGKIFHLF